MEIQQAAKIFSALSQETRLCALRLLVRAGPQGLPAGQMSKKLGVPCNTLSFHLAHLEKTGIVVSFRSGRSIIYQAQYEIIQKLVQFLVKNCCEDK